MARTTAKMAVIKATRRVKAFDLISSNSSGLGSSTSGMAYPLFEEDFPALLTY